MNKPKYFVTIDLPTEKGVTTMVVYPQAAELDKVGSTSFTLKSALYMRDELVEGLPTFRIKIFLDDDTIYHE